MTDVALNPEQGFTITPEMLNEGLLASLQEVLRAKDLPLNEKAIYVVVLPFYEKFRVRTLTILCLVVAAGVIGWVALQGPTTEGGTNQDVAADVTATNTPALSVSPTVEATLIFTGGEQGIAPTKHTVQPNETLTRISLRYGVSVPEIVAANGITNPNLIWAGQELVIPQAGAQAEQTTTQPTPTLEPQTAGYLPLPEKIAPWMLGQMIDAHRYCVNQGDTLSAIALRFGRTVEELADWNEIDPDVIFIGQFLLVNP
jgi:lysozyme